MIAEEFNTFFVSIGSQLASNISSSTNHMFYNTVANSIFIPDITIEVINVILLLKNSCAGWDDIPAYVIKKVHKCLHRTLNTYLLQTTDLFLFYLSSQRYLKELCIIISMTLLTPLIFSINTHLDLDINTLLITLVNKITSSLDTGDLVIGMFLDLKKVFDTVDHKILHDKMHAYVIRVTY